MDRYTLIAFYLILRPRLDDRQFHLSSVSSNISPQYKRIFELGLTINR